MNEPAVTSDALAAFATFAEHLNFTRAAAELRISQPALHVKIRKLAATLDRPLYRRVGRRLELTPDGTEVAGFARDSAARLDRFLAGLRATPEHRPIVLAAGEGAFLYVLGDVIAAARSSRLRLLNTDRDRTLAAVRTGRAHLGVAVLDVLPDDLVALPVASYPQTLLVPADHALAGRRRVRLRDLAGAALVVPPPQRPHRVTIERALRDREVAWTVAVEAEGWPLTLHFVASGVGLAIVNGCVPPPPGFVALELAELPKTTYYAVHRDGALDDERVASLLAAVRSRAGSTVGSPTV